MKLTDLQRKQIIAEYVAGDGKVSQRSLAQKYHVSPSLISKILLDKKSVQKCTYKKKENELTMLAFLDARTCKAQELIDMILNSLPQDLEKANIRDKAGLFKILTETFKSQEQGKSEPITGIKVRFVDASGDNEDGTGN